MLEVCYDATELRTLAARDLFDPPRAGARVRPTTPITDGLRPGDGEIVLDYGTLTVAQLDLMLAAVPADFSFGDEHDILLHFSEGGIYEDCDRGVIGGTMQECHPPGAQAALQRILDEFRGGRSRGVRSRRAGREGLDVSPLRPDPHCRRRLSWHSRMQAGHHEVARARGRAAGARLVAPFGGRRRR